MSYKALALYPMPDNPQAFRDHYQNTHLPLVAWAVEHAKRPAA
jgi:hypothetical protein